MPAPSESSIPASVIVRHKQEGNRVDTIGGRRDGVGDKENGANQRCAAFSCEMPRHLKGKGIEQMMEYCLRLKNEKERGFHRVTATQADEMDKKHFKYRPAAE